MVNTILKRKIEQHPNPRIAVIGGGSWATALVKIITDNGLRVRWWMRSQESINYIERYGHNGKYLSSVQLNLKKCKLSNNLKRVIRTSDIVVVAVPSAFVKSVFDGFSARIIRGRTIVSSIKGMIPEDNYIMADYFVNEFGVKLADYLVVGGPCHAEEVAQEKLSYLTVGGSTKVRAEKLASLLKNRYVRTKVSTDVAGIEYAEVLKNIVAIASGICRGCGFGDNFQAVLISNAIREIEHFVDVVDPKERNINDSVYLGDLLVTSYSQFSRNRTFGNMIGKGYSVKSAQLEMQMVAEGYYAVKCLHDLNQAKYKVDMPITTAVYNILYEKYAPMLEMRLLSEKLN